MSWTALNLRLLAAIAVATLPLVFPTLNSAALAQQPLPTWRPSPIDLKIAVIDSVKVQTQVLGHNATAEIEIVLRNPNSVVIESSLEFPLQEGQTVSQFSMESLDKSRFFNAAPVEKSKGQALFEQIVREGADPALLEKTAGNNFKLRVYPIPANGSRTVRFEITELLSPNKAGRLTYQMSQMLQGSKPKKFSFSLDLEGVSGADVRLSNGLKTAKKMTDNESTRLTFNPTERTGAGDYSLSWKSPEKVLTEIGVMDGARYFHTQIPLSVASETRNKPNHVTLVWDASGSGINRDHARELAFLDATFKSFGDVMVSLIETHVAAEAPKTFDVKKGNWDALRTALEKIQYDGASNPATWSAQIPSARDNTQQELAGFKNLTLVFSDGIGNWGQPSATQTVGAVYAISSVAGANAAALRDLAEPTGGQLIDLLKTPAAQAFAELSTARARLVRMRADGADQLVSMSTYAANGMIQISGHLTKDSANVTLDLEMPNGTRLQRSLQVKNANRTAGPAPTLAARRWAAMRIAQLEANARLHQSEILRLGSEFGVVSSRTSLIILESLEDHLRFNVMPSDPAWRDQYLQRAASKAGRDADEQGRHLTELVKRFEARVKWWETDFPKDAKPPVPSVSASVAAPSPALAMMTAPAPAPTARAPLPPNAAPSANSSSDVSAITPPRQPREMTISVQKQQLTSAYAARLHEATSDERFAIYLDEKSANSKSSAFYLDASDIFFEKGQSQIGLRVLSNLAEIQFEEKSLLRILGYRLQQAKMFDQAILLFKQIRILAPNEPQSWRDLGLAYAANGQRQEAVDALWTTASRKWDSRFADIDLIALAELNTIVANNPTLDVSKINPRLLRNLQVDLRVIIAWDADNTDIDLWVTDPNGEHAYYGNQKTYQGGRMSRDFTAGYGPEEFVLKVAKPGRYEVRGKFFGSRQQRFSPYTTITAHFITGFGTKNQKEDSVIVRLPEKGNEVSIGSFEVKPD